MDFLEDDYSIAQKFFDFWNAYRKIIYFIIFIALAALLLFKYIDHEKTQKRRAAFDHYQTFVVSLEKEDKASMMRASKILKESFPEYFFTPLAIMRQVKVYLDGEQYEPARESLLWLIDNPLSDEIALLSKIKLAQLDLITKNYEEATNILRAIDNEHVAVLVQKLQGDLAVLHQDYRQAIEYYQVILNAEGVPADMREILTAKVNYYYQKGHKL